MIKTSTEIITLLSNAYGLSSAGTQRAFDGEADKAALEKKQTRFTLREREHIMRSKTVLLALAALAMTVAVAPASWATTIDGITFQIISGNSSTMVLEISGTGTGDNGAACGTGGYCGVNNLEAIALNHGTYGTATLGSTVTGTGFTAGGTFTFDGNQLDNTGCGTVNGNGFGSCFNSTGSTFGTTFDVKLTFTNVGGAGTSFDPNFVDIKACFSVTAGGATTFCQGDLVSQIISG